MLLNQRGWCCPLLLTGSALGRGCCLCVKAHVVRPMYDHETCQYCHWLTSLLGRLQEGDRDSHWHPQTDYLNLSFSEKNLCGSCYLGRIPKGPISHILCPQKGPFKCFFFPQRNFSLIFHFRLFQVHEHPVQPLPWPLRQCSFISQASLLAGIVKTGRTSLPTVLKDTTGGAVVL